MGHSSGRKGHLAELAFKIRKAVKFFIIRLLSNENNDSGFYTILYHQLNLLTHQSSS